MLLKRTTSLVDQWLKCNEQVFELLRKGATHVAREDGLFMVLTNFDTYARAQGQTADELFDVLVQIVGDLGVAKLELVYTGWDCSPHIMISSK